MKMEQEQKEWLSKYGDLTRLTKDYEYSLNSLSGVVGSTSGPPVVTSSLNISDEQLKTLKEALFGQGIITKNEAVQHAHPYPPNTAASGGSLNIFPITTTATPPYITLPTEGWDWTKTQQEYPDYSPKIKAPAITALEAEVTELKEVVKDLQEQINDLWEAMQDNE